MRDEELIKELHGRLATRLKELTGLDWLIEIDHDLLDYQFRCGASCITKRFFTASRSTLDLNRNSINQIAEQDAKMIYVNYQYFSGMR